MIPLRLYDRGYTPLVSVIPPGANLSPSSRIAQNQLGKTPGTKDPTTGMWRGYPWMRTDADRDMVLQWDADGSNIGLRAERFPAIDIDVKHGPLAEIIRQCALDALGAAPWRVGAPPKSLLVYRADEPFGRLGASLKTTDGEKAGLVEVLGDGQQYLVYGRHPAGALYTWPETPLWDIDPADLPLLTRDAAVAFLQSLGEQLAPFDIDVDVQGTGVRRLAPTQDNLKAPTPARLLEAVRLIPNDERYGDRAAYVEMAHAIRAAAQDFPSDGEEAWMEWGFRWDGGDNTQEELHRRWRGLAPPYRLGWNWIAERAREFGFDDSADDFDADDPVAVALADAREAIEEPEWSEAWVGVRVANALLGRIRYAPASERWYVWKDGLWIRDAVNEAHALMSAEMSVLADRALRIGAENAARMRKVADHLRSTAGVRAVRAFVQIDPRITIRPEEVFDREPTLLNTPNGVVNLMTGVMQPHAADLMCSRQTLVPPQERACPRWLAFLHDATGGDAALQEFLQDLAGYSLTGETREQKVFFIYGSGLNGKSVFIETLKRVVGSYALSSTMDEFMFSYGERHTTGIAAMAGARLVTASETTQGRKWDEQRVKSLSGGEEVSARFMRQDNFTFRPVCKLVFIGNHKPAITNLDDAMKRRLAMIPFAHKPPVVDPDLSKKLEAEFPAILQWMIDGAQRWYERGLVLPAIVTDASEEYFHEEDRIGLWMDACCLKAANGVALSETLFSSWREWCGRNNDPPGAIRTFVAALQQRGFGRYQDAKTRRNGFRGITLRDPTGTATDFADLTS